MMGGRGGLKGEGGNRVPISKGGRGVVSIYMLFTDLIFERVGAWVVLSKVKVSHLRDSSILPSNQSFEDSKPLIELDFEKISLLVFLVYL